MCAGSARFNALTHPDFGASRVRRSRLGKTSAGESRKDESHFGSTWRVILSNGAKSGWFAECIPSVVTVRRSDLECVVLITVVARPFISRRTGKPVGGQKDMASVHILLSLFSFVPIFTIAMVAIFKFILSQRDFMEICSRNTKLLSSHSSGMWQWLSFCHDVTLLLSNKILI